MSESKARTERQDNAALAAAATKPRSRWQIVERVALVVGLVAAVAAVVGLWFTVVAVRQSNAQIAMSEDQWAAGSANVELASKLLSSEAYVGSNPPSVTTTRSFVSYLVTKTGSALTWRGVSSGSSLAGTFR